MMERDGCYFEVRNLFRKFDYFIEGPLTIYDASHCALHNTDTEPDQGAGG
jgi:hypothetical protein